MKTIPPSTFITDLEVIPPNAAGGGSGTVTEVDTALPITGGPITTSGTISHATSGVAAGTYGDASNYPVVTVDVYGHVTAVTNQAAGGGGSRNAAMWQG